MDNRWAKRERWIHGVCSRMAQTFGRRSSVVRDVILTVFIPGIRLSPTALIYLILSYLLLETVEF